MASDDRMFKLLVELVDVVVSACESCGLLVDTHDIQRVLKAKLQNKDQLFDCATMVPYCGVSSKPGCYRSGLQYWIENNLWRTPDIACTFEMQCRHAYFEHILFSEETTQDLMCYELLCACLRGQLFRRESRDTFWRIFIEYMEKHPYLWETVEDHHRSVSDLLKKVLRANTNARV